MTKLDKNTEVSLEELASITSRTKSWLNKLAADGYFKSERHGMYRIGNVVAGLIKHAREEKRGAAQTPTKTRVDEARARQIEQRTALEGKKLMRYTTHVEILDIIVGGIRAELNGMAGRLTRDRTLRAEYEKHFHDMSQRLTDRWNALAKGETPKDDTAEDDE